MLQWLPDWLVGAITITTYIIVTALLALPLFVFAFLKVMLPMRRWRVFWSHFVNAVADLWIMMVHTCMRLKSKLYIDVSGLEALKRKGWYLIISNHQSWVDIFMLTKLFHRRIPSFRFFIKKQLLWIPVIGFAFWALDFPIIKRAGKKKSNNSEKLKVKNIKASQRACAKYLTMPVSIVNFVEGTRFKPCKHKAQQSPYTHLLKAKAGGIAYVLASMGQQLDYLLNVTIVYPEGVKSFWQFLCGKVRTVKIHIEAMPVIQDMIGDYDGDPAFKQRFQVWVNQLWQEKDQQVSALLTE